MYKIRITEELNDNIFGQYKGVYLNSENKLLVIQGRYGGNISLTLRTNDVLTVDSTPLQSKRKLEIGKEYDFDGICSIYAKNPSMGALFHCTNIICTPLETV